MTDVHRRALGAATTARRPALVNGRNEERAPLAQMLAVGTALLIGMRVDLPYGLTAGGLLALVLAPLWFPTALPNRGSLVLAAACVGAVATGFLLPIVGTSLVHVSVAADAVARSASVVQLAIVVGFLVWAHRVTSVATTTLAVAGGMAASIPLHVSDDPNLWRFTLSIPVGILALTLSSLVDRLWLTLAVLGALAVLGLANDSRSNSAFLVLTAVVIVWQRVAATSSGRARGWAGVASLVAAGGAVAMILQSAILEGAFGEVTQARTAEQIARGGNILVGGRPEIAASVALIERHPWGLGTGVRADYEDIQAAKSAMMAIGYDPNNGYVERFMFGGGIELHSVLGDLWMWFGVGGIAVAVVVLGLLLRGLSRGYAAGALTPVFVFLSARAAWDLLFSPVDSALRVWPLMLSLAVAYATSRFASPCARLGSLGFGAAEVGRPANQRG